MPVIPFAIQCTIPEHKLLALKESVNGDLVSSFVSNIPGFEYCLSIFPNGSDDKNPGQTWIGLYLKLGNVKKVEADFNIIIESANYSHNIRHTYKEMICRIHNIAETEEFFDPDKKYSADGKFTFKINGTFKFETKNYATLDQQKWDGGELGNVLWEENGEKDFTFVVDGKEIKVHKLLLLARSDVFRAMFSPNTKETIEKKVKISDFSLEVVETAVKMIYNCTFTSSLSLDKMMLLLQFFNKYQIPLLKDKVELLLIDQVSEATVYRLTNASILSNSIQLKNKCMEFLEKSFASKTYLSDIEILDNDVLKKVVENSFYKIVKI